MKEQEKKKITPRIPIKRYYGVTETDVARMRGLMYPEAGVPDFEAIEEAFGFTPEDLQLFDHSRKIHRSKKHGSFKSE
jgi:hypothetical protein